MTAGLATLRIEREGNQEHVIGTADSTGVVALLFRVQDRFNSYFDAHSLCSNKLVKHTEEGSHWRDTEITFDYKIRKAVLQEKNLKNGQTKRTENDIPGCVTDVVSGILVCRKPSAAARHDLQSSAERRRQDRHDSGPRRGQGTDQDAGRNLSNDSCRSRKAITAC